MKYTPDILNAVYEFQGGAFDGWSVHMLLNINYNREVIDKILGEALVTQHAQHLLVPNSKEVLYYVGFDSCFSNQIELSVLQERICDVNDISESIHDIWRDELGRNSPSR